jgi:hypothetical protein
MGLVIPHAWMALSTMRAAMREWQKVWAMYMPTYELKKIEIFMPLLLVHEKDLL